MAVDVAAPGELLRVLAEPMRWEIVRRLAAEDLCTCHLVVDLAAAQPLVSHHLRVLRQAGVVRAEPCGSFTYYTLRSEVLDAVAAALLHVAAAAGEGRRRRPCA